MKEVKKPHKPLIYYYGIVVVVLLILNLLIVPLIEESAIKEVDYGTFMQMTEDKNIGLVEVQQSRIVFSDSAKKQVYKTGIMNDPELIDRLYNAGATFSSPIEEQMSPLLSFL